MSRASLHVTSGAEEPSRAAWCARVHCGAPDGLRAPEQLLDVPERVMVENRRPEVAQSLRRADEHAGADEADDRQVLRDQLLHAIVEALAELRIAGRELPPHQRVDFRFPRRGRLALPGFQRCVLPLESQTFISLFGSPSPPPRPSTHAS